MATMTLEKLVADTNYADVELLVYKVAHKFQRQFGGDIEEIIAEANLAYAAGVKCWCRRRSEGKHSSFATWIYWCVGKDLMTNLRNRQRRKAIADIKPTDMTEADYSMPQPRFSLVEFVDELSPDARMVAALAIDPPHDLAGVMREEGSTGYSDRRTLRYYLTGMGWTGERIASTFEEIADKLEQ